MHPSPLALAQYCTPSQITSWLDLMGVAKIAIIILVGAFLPATPAAGAKERSWRTPKTFVAGTPPSKRYFLL